ncbi:hypothetical protein TREAZ_1968 [Leadbettera azotonutricia ZAS-9]|uniref:Uncharacterized protein n=1 Tax=Leadbettera azotonutricia (strain ATCC BAA-888 / DSM 13862 / ZAS-9) TaxID=545695 RepID=F5YAN7_LEAAZ|nr:hypothetical protein TREAZ_1968 [Leadbettera azotonutricia ZAS-9]
MCTSCAFAGDGFLFIEETRGTTPLRSPMAGGALIILNVDLRL